MRCITCAGFAAATSASSRTASTAFGSGTRTRTTTIGSGDPGRSPPGSTDQPVAPFSTISTVAARLDLDLPREPGGGAAQPVQLDRPGDDRAPPLLVPALVERDPHPAREPGEEVVGRQVRVEVRVEVVERAPDRRVDLVQRAEEALREVVVLVDRGQRRTHRVRRHQPVDAPCASGALDQDLVLVAEHQGMRLELEARRLLPALRR